jgi:hypothetical protein
MQRTVKERVSSYRNRRREAGFRSVQIWVPDAKSPEFAEECRRQSRVISNCKEEMHDLEMFAEIADWDGE